MQDLNVLFPSDCSLAHRLQEVAEAKLVKGELLRMQGRDRLRAAPHDADGVFVAREQARADLQTLLGQRRTGQRSPEHGGITDLVLLQGPAGVGKSALARMIAEDSLEHHSWVTAYYADLSSCRTVEDLALVLCSTFQVRTAQASPPLFGPSPPPPPLPRYAPGPPFPLSACVHSALLLG